MSLKFGIVSQIDPARGLARVRFGDSENLESYWLHVLGAATMKNKLYHLPDVGEGVACHMDEHCENGVILGALYSKQDIPPVSDQDKYHILFEDGTYIEYDRAAHKLTANVKGSVELHADKDVTIDTRRFRVTASQEIDLRTPRFTVDDLDESGDCDTDWNGVMRLRGLLEHRGDYEHTGDQMNTGDVSATGTIMDQSGNSNHHAH